MAAIRSIDQNLDVHITGAGRCRDEIAQPVHEVKPAQDIKSILVALDQCPDAVGGRVANMPQFRAEGLEHQSVERRAVGARVSQGLVGLLPLVIGHR